MTMKQINLEIPENHEIDLEKSSLEKGKIVFKKKKIKLPTTNEECIPYLSEKCYCVGTYGDIIDVEFDLDKGDKNTLPSKEYAEAFVALMQLVKFRDIWNGGWFPDWEDASIKYIIYFYQEEKTEENQGLMGSAVLSFKTPELRDKFSKIFDDLIQQAKPLL